MPTPLTATAQVAPVAKTDYTPQVITGVFSISGTLLGLFLGFVLQRWSKGRDERAQVRREFFALKIGIMTETLENNISPKLLEMKKFLALHPEIISKNTAAAKLYGRWLQHPTTDMGFTGTGFWTQGTLKEMLDDLAPIVL